MTRRALLLLVVLHALFARDVRAQPASDAPLPSDLAVVVLIRTLSQVVSFFDRGGDGPGEYPGSNELQPLSLSEQQRAHPVAFLATLDGAGRRAKPQT